MTGASIQDAPTISACVLWCSGRGSGDFTAYFRFSSQALLQASRLKALPEAFRNHPSRIPK
ncbi:hypothetical protein B0H12DRAFT_1146599 [Mycena haematopus]|nr:hypothetical protein B0H12DRAFT_1146599 [Mycena haematopus]